MEESLLVLSDSQESLCIKKQPFIRGSCQYLAKIELLARLNVKKGGLLLFWYNESRIL